jgi:hypothetical protein
MPIRDIHLLFEIFALCFSVNGGRLNGFTSFSPKGWSTEGVSAGSPMPTQNFAFASIWCTSLSTGRQLKPRFSNQTIFLYNK